MKKILKITFLVLIVIISSLIIYQLSQNNPKAVLRRLVKEGNFDKKGNAFVFTPKFFGIIPVGEAILSKGEIKNHEGKEVYYLFAQAQPADFVNKMYSVKAGVESYLDKETLLPFLFKHKAQIQDKPDDEKEVFYDQEKHVMVIDNEERVILPNTYGPLSAILFIRNSDLENLEKFNLNINTNQTNYAMKSKNITKENINISDKEFGVWQVEAEIFRRKKSHYHQSEITFYFLDDQAKTPILLEVSTNGLYFVAPLKEIR